MTRTRVETFGDKYIGFQVNASNWISLPTHQQPQRLT